MIYRIDVEVTTPLNPTESRDRVEAAIAALFPTAEIQERTGEMVGRTRSLDRLAERLRDQAIVDTAREVFLRNRSDDAFWFVLKKQAATEGVVNFAIGEPGELGELHVRVRVEEPGVVALIDHLAPATGGD